MKKNTLIIFVSLLACVFFSGLSGCGWRAINLAKANFIKKVGENPKKFNKSNFNLVGHLVIVNNLPNDRNLIPQKETRMEKKQRLVRELRNKKNDS
ncbi:hypothetical protein KAR28_00150 [Candidatus Parcubacteria bacterium]|nr:hypothetical protein [Candidatus Parcubacteria bacterium]